MESFSLLFTYLCQCDSFQNTNENLLQQLQHLGAGGGKSSKQRKAFNFTAALSMPQFPTARQLWEKQKCSGRWRLDREVLLEYTGMKVQHKANRLITQGFASSQLRLGNKFPQEPGLLQVASILTPSANHSSSA